MWVSFANEMQCHVKTENWYATQKDKVFRRHYAFELPTFSHPSTLNGTYLVLTLRRDSLTQKKGTFSKYRKTRLSFKKNHLKMDASS